MLSVNSDISVYVHRTSHCSKLVPDVLTAEMSAR